MDDLIVDAHENEQRKGFNLQALKGVLQFPNSYL